ncbi:glycosyltransferase [Candidatus Acetothermia bacterium]|nr:glycosyltransferase [Candidatus Acetothermia bacterium]
MHFQFDQTYIARTQVRVAMVVLNPVLGDSRVLRTAQTLKKLGYNIRLYGLSPNDKTEEIEGHPFSITLLKNPSYELARAGSWKGDRSAHDFSVFTRRFSEYLRDELKNEPAQILHTHDMDGLAVGKSIKEHDHFKSLLWIHDIHHYLPGLAGIMEEGTRKFLMDTEESSIHRPDLLISVDTELAAVIQKSYALTEMPAINLSTPFYSEFDPLHPREIRGKLGLASDAPLLVYCGNIDPVRGIDTVIEALPLLAEAHLALVTNSSGSFVESLKERATALGVEQRIHFHPYVPFFQLTSFLRSATIGISPVRRYPQADMALFTKLFEYIHARLPIVTSDNICMAQFVRDHDCGLSFEAGNATQFAAAVERVMERRNKEAGWIEKIEQLAKKYCWENCEPVLAQLYDSLAEIERRIPKSPATKMSEKRILHLPIAIAGQHHVFPQCLKTLGAKADSLVIGENPFGYPSDLQPDVAPTDFPALCELLERVAGQYDIFHFHAVSLFYGRTNPLFYGMDLLLLKAMGKRVFFHFRGDEIRMPSVFEKMSPYHYVNDNPNQMYSYINEPDQRAFRDFVTSVCDRVLTTDAELQTYAPESLIVPRALDLRQWEYLGAGQNKIIKIVHAPSNRGIKGTDFILQAIERLKNEGLDFEFSLIENRSHEEATNLYREADIIIDQVRIGTFAMVTTEAMALGKAVVVFYRDDLKHYLPTPLPVANANPENLYLVLKDLIQDREKIRALGLLGRKYVEEHHDVKHLSEILLRLYELPADPVRLKAIERYYSHILKQVRERAETDLRATLEPGLEAKYEARLEARTADLRASLQAELAAMKEHSQVLEAQRMGAFSRFRRAAKRDGLFAAIAKSGRFVMRQFHK